MLRPIFCLQILSVILFSCNNREAIPDSASSPIESAPPDTVIIGSIPEPEGQAVEAEKLLAIEGSVQTPFDTLSLAFDLREKNYELVYKKGEELYFFDSKSRESLPFPDTGRIFQFVLTPDGNSLYYTVIQEETLVLKRAMLTGKKALIACMRQFDIPLRDFISGFTGKGSRIGMYGNILSIGFGMINEHFSFSSNVHIVCDTDSSYLIESVPPSYYQNRGEDYQTRMASVTERLRLEKKGVHKELFLISAADTIQLSDTHSLFQDSLFKELNIYKDYVLDQDAMFDRALFETVQFSPDGSKILYSYPCVLHDFVHGPMYLVQANGDFLKLLSIDGGFSRDQRPAWLADGNNVVFHRNNNNESSGLFMTINAENEFIRIAEDVEQFEIR